ncbi:MAG: hypothetical protein ABFC89_13245 [Methanospirillum sp.]
MSSLDIDSKKIDTGGGERPAETTAAARRRTRGGTSYQHSLSARGIKTSGRARSQSDEDLQASLERLDKATRRPSFEDEEAEVGSSRTRAFGRHASERHHAPDDGVEQRVRGPRFDW